MTRRKLLLGGPIAVVLVALGLAFGGVAPAYAVSGQVGVPYGSVGTTWFTGVGNWDIGCYQASTQGILNPNEILNDTPMPFVQAGFTGQKATLYLLLWGWTGSGWALKTAAQQTTSGVNRYGFYMWLQPFGVIYVPSGYYAVSYWVSWYGANGTTVVGYKHFPIGGYVYYPPNGAATDFELVPWCQIQ
ncbi:MAG TPA: hypothetical protein VIB48_13450 [Acidimicrobiia bacterium]|jgi:hypothetical protein